MRSERLIVALDFAKETDAKALVRTLKKDVSIFKIGLQLYTKAGPSIIKAVQKGDHKVFLDLKFHDIPTTVAKAVMEATQHGVFMLTLHALGGKEMMERAVEAATDAADQLSLIRPKIVAVTIPTSRQDVQDIGINASLEETVLRLAKLAQSAGCDGVVCSPREISMIRQACGDDFLIVAPGIRLGGEEDDDQKRVDTPQAAFKEGASYIVVGRPILRAADPSLAVQKINASIHGLDPDKVTAPEPEPEAIDEEVASEEAVKEEPAADIEPITVEASEPIATELPHIEEPPVEAPSEPAVDEAPVGEVEKEASPEPLLIPEAPPQTQEELPEKTAEPEVLPSESSEIPPKD